MRLIRGCVLLGTHFVRCSFLDLSCAMTDHPPPRPSPAAGYSWRRCPLSVAHSIVKASFSQISAFIKILSDSLSTPTINVRNLRCCLHPCPLVASLPPSILGRHNLRRRDESRPLLPLITGRCSFVLSPPVPFQVFGNLRMLRYSTKGG